MLENYVIFDGRSQVVLVLHEDSHALRTLLPKETRSHKIRMVNKERVITTQF
jgi:hypothetical protein